MTGGRRNAPPSDSNICDYRIAVVRHASNVEGGFQLSLVAQLLLQSSYVFFDKPCYNRRMDILTILIVILLIAWLFGWRGGYGGDWIHVLIVIVVIIIILRLLGVAI